LADDPTIAALMDRFAQLRRENAELAAKNKVLRADFEELRKRCKSLQSSPPKPQK
jgi:cell division protein FtsB